MKKLIVLLLAVLLLLNIGSGFTQESEEPLLHALSLIPNTAASRAEMIVFADMAALEAVYGTERPASPEAFSAMMDADEPESDPALIPQVAWWRTLTSFSFPGDLAQSFQVEDGNLGIGINFFQIDSAISYGRPPEHALMLLGDFDQEAIRAVYTAKDYVQQEGVEGEIWCGAAGCEAGYQTNIETREPENPFGGNLGRRQPVAIGESSLMSSPQIALVEDHAAAASGSMESLADELRYQAAVQAVTQQGTLVQALFLDQVMLLEMMQTGGGEMIMVDPRLTQEQRAAILSAILEDYETLPVYNLLIIADVVTETDQVVQVGLVFPDEADAQTAAQVLANRIQAYTSMFYNRPMVDILADRRAEIHEPTLYSGVEGYHVVVLTFSTPRPADLNELIAATEITLNDEDRPDVTAPGILYRFFIGMVMQRDLGWLSTVPREELEAVLQKLESDN